MNKHNDPLYQDDIGFSKETPPPCDYYDSPDERQDSDDDHDRFIHWWSISINSFRYLVGGCLALGGIYGLSKLIDWAHRQ